jgi:hypothetical protein
MKAEELQARRVGPLAKSNHSITRISMSSAASTAEYCYPKE